MLKIILACIIIFFVMLSGSCKKESAGNPTPSLDTLSTGWTKVNVPDYGYVDIFFSNANQGIRISDTRILKSINGGSSWEQIYTAQDLVNIAMTGDTAIVVSKQKKLYITYDGGITMDSVALDDPNMKDVFFASSKVAYAAGNKLWKTTDAGRTWHAIYTFGNSTDYYALYFKNETVGFVGYPKGFFKTTDGGLTWTKVFDTQSVSFSFVSDLNGYALTLPASSVLYISFFKVINPV